MFIAGRLDIDLNEAVQHPYRCSELDCQGLGQHVQIYQSRLIRHVLYGRRRITDEKLKAA
jgi:hypothetical protein